MYIIDPFFSFKKENLQKTHTQKLSSHHSCRRDMEGEGSIHYVPTIQGYLTQTTRQHIYPVHISYSISTVQKFNQH